MSAPQPSADPRPAVVRGLSPTPSLKDTSMASTVFAALAGPGGRAPPPPTYENTYRLRDPDSPSKFNKTAVAAIITQKLASKFDGAVYDSQTAAGVANELSCSIKDAVKATGLDRYKLIVHVTVGQRCGQSMRLGSRCLWDAASDNFVSGSYESDTLFSSVQVYALYIE